MNIKLTVFTLCVLLIASCDRSGQRANALLDQFEADFYPPANTITAFRVTLDTNDDVQELIRLQQAPAVVLQRLSANITTMHDEMIALSAYVLEKRNYDKAIPVLEDYLKSNPGNRAHIWGGTFAVRALLKLKNMPDGSGGYQNYDDATVIRAIFQNQL